MTARAYDPWGGHPIATNDNRPQTTMAQRFDVVHLQNHCTIEPHFCRQWDEDGGCYGTNPNHGFSFDEACDQVARWHEQQAKEWRERTAYECTYYLGQEQ